MYVVCFVPVLLKCREVILNDSCVVYTVNKHVHCLHLYTNTVLRVMMNLGVRDGSGTLTWWQRSTVDYQERLRRRRS